MKAFGQEVPDHPKLPNQHLRNFRTSLIIEEARELQESTDLVSYADAVGDLLYVVLGAACAAGFNADLVGRIFQEVHQSNMTKVWTDKDISSAKRRLVDDGCTIQQNGETFIVRNQHGKVVKSPSYARVNLDFVNPNDEVSA